MEIRSSVLTSSEWHKERARSSKLTLEWRGRLCLGLSPSLKLLVDFALPLNKSLVIWFLFSLFENFWSRSGKKWITWDWWLPVLVMLDCWWNTCCCCTCCSPITELLWIRVNLEMVIYNTQWWPRSTFQPSSSFQLVQNFQEPPGFDCWANMCGHQR